MYSTNKIEWLQQQFDILTQKNGFLTAQLAESQEREQGLKKLYDKLNETIHQKDMPFLHDTTMEQLKRAQEQHQIDVENLRQSKNEVIDRLESQLKEANLQKLELELNLKTQQVMTERQDLDVSNQLSEILQAKTSAEAQLDTQQTEKQQLQSQLKETNRMLSEAQEQVAAKENKLQEVASLTSYTNIKSLIDVVAKKDERIAQLTSQLQEAQQISTSRQRCGQCYSLMQKLCKMTELLKKTKLKLEQTQIQKEKLTVDLDRSNLKLKQQSMEFSTSTYEQTTNSEELKSEVKFLIGKLVEAKAESQSLRTTRTSQDPSTSRRRPKNRLSTLSQINERSISPIDLSVINRMSSSSFVEPE